MTPQRAALAAARFLRATPGFYACGAAQRLL